MQPPNFRPPEDPAAAAQSGQQQQAAPVQKAPNGELATEICKNFLAKGAKGACKFGNKCRYLHLDFSDPRTQGILSQQRPKTPPPREEIGRNQPGLSALSLNPAARVNPADLIKKDKPG